jgi:outer membrane receptor protein involved in Fe transport
MASFRLAQIACIAGLLVSSTTSAQVYIEDIIIQAEFRPINLMETPNSISLISADDISNRSANFLTDVLGSTPNLNYSSGASRGRFFQIRGIGERSQFVDPLNPGVGLMIDGIDYSTLGAAATLFDINQVEVLRGPQGTLFGANALAGLINITSNDPSENPEVILTAGIGDISGNEGAADSSNLGLILSGPLSDSINGRLAIQNNKSDGFVENVFLGRDDTQNIDELTARGKLNWLVSDVLDISITAIKLDIDNGYDSFTLDNQRETISDEPGTDALDSFALSSLAKLELSGTLDLEVLLSTAQSDSEYSFDEDWVNLGLCGGADPADCYWYSSFDEYLRDTSTDTLDLRLISELPPNGIGWILGLYGKSQNADLTRNYKYSDPFTPESTTAFSSGYKSHNTAVYGEITLPTATTATQLRIGMRVENFNSDYSDSLAQSTDTDETLVGGHATYEVKILNQHFAYIRVARGYKTGGVNVAQGAIIPLEYKTESLLNYEFGLKSTLDSGLNSQLSFFYQDRRDAQVKQSFVDCPAGGGGCSFEDFVDNAAEAHSFGMEAEVYLSVNDRLNLSASLGLMKTEFDEYLSLSHINAEEIGGAVIPYDMSGEPLAQSPEYQFSLSADYSLSDNLGLWVSVDSKDQFRFSNRHFAKSEAYTLLNARLMWNASDDIELSLWGRNLTNEDFTTRGFGSFGNDPRDGYTPDNYFQFGEPREVGLSVKYRL